MDSGSLESRTMNTHDIRAAIKAGFDHEARTNAVRRLLDGLPITDAAREEIIGFIRAYVSETPELMDAAYVGASKAGIGAAVQPLFDAAFEYWATPLDFIPNHLGLVGITDDAYLTRSLMGHVSNRHAQQTGSPLFDVDLAPANQAMRKVIGEPVASLLDQAVANTVGQPNLQQLLQQLTGLGGLPVGMPSGAWSNSLESARIQHEVDVRLGAMGVV